MQLRKKNFLLVAISGSPDYMVHAFAKATGFDAAFGRTLEVREGTYTGRVMKDNKPVGIFAHQHKVDILKKFIADRSLTVDLRECIAVGDSEGDIELLEAVGHPIAFNPSSFLATIAKRRGWRIIVERKDMVYDIKNAAFIPLSDKPKTRVT
jgi:phosphoserine phosphatase